MNYPTDILTSEAIQRNFYIGDQWLYYKIYCGPRTADDLLLKIIAPFCEALIVEHKITKWFYIRYSDPKPHLRLRLYFEDLDALSVVLTRFRNRISGFLSSGLISSLITDTYKRELERYGNSILISEDFFFFDSKNAIQIIDSSDSETSRFIYAFNWVRYFIKYCVPEQDDHIDFVNRMQANFRKEFNVDKQLNKELQTKYKKLEKKLDLKTWPKDHLFNKVPESLKSLAAEHRQNALSVSWQQLLMSYIHMSINRIFRSDQRRYELLIYDFIKKQNDTKMARYGEL